MKGKRKNTPDQIDQLLAQYEQKKRARIAQHQLQNAALVIDDAWTQLSKTPVPVDVNVAVGEALKQLKIAMAKVDIYVERLPPVEKS